MSESNNDTSGSNNKFNENNTGRGNSNTGRGDRGEGRGQGWRGRCGKYHIRSGCRSWTIHNNRKKGNIEELGKNVFDVEK